MSDKKDKKDRKPIENGVLAEGEATGHYHQVVDENGPLEVFERQDGSREFKVSKTATIKHQEHKPITLPAGEYVCDRVLEYDHLAEEARQVAD